MDIVQIRKYCLAKPLATEDCAFGPDGVLFRVYNKIFAYIDLTTPDRVVLKCDPDRAVSLRDKYHGIEGAWHWNKRYWNAVKLEEDVPEKVILELIDHSLAEVIRKMPRTKQAEYATLLAPTS